MSLTANDRYRIERALLNRQQELMERAIQDIDSEPLLFNAVKLVERHGKKRDGNVSRTQLSALRNMARSQPAEEIRYYMQLRAERRRKAGKSEEADFWEALYQKSKKVATLTAEVLADAGIKNPDSELLQHTESSIVGAYLEHAVAHCLYRTQFIVEEV